MTDREKKNQIADILLDFYDEYNSNVINRPMIPNIYAGKILDSLQEEPVRCDFEMALAEMIDKAQKCVVEPWVVAAQWKDELVKLAKECKAMQEHPKDCMYSKDNYTDEDRKILCEGCEEDCKYNKKEEPVSEDLEEASKNHAAERHKTTR